MTYESEVLFKLMERDGFNIPSSVPPYEAEIKAYLINQVKNAYPKLTDYEAEWLLYNYTKHLPADFPITSVTNVTNASFENVVPFAYQSAILKGQTLVNVFSNATSHYQSNATYTGNKTINLTSSGAVCHSWWNVDLLTTKQYMLSINITTNTSTGNLLVKTKDETLLKNFDVGVTGKQIIIFTPTDGGMRFKYESPLNSGTTIIDDIMLMEYQEGMENWDIPYFEGMKSVQMPVLTTVGKNLFDGTIVGNYYVDGTGTLIPIADCYATDYIEIESDTNYCLNTPTNERTGFYDKDKIFISEVRSTSFLTPSNAKFLRTTIKPLSLLDTFQLEKGSVKTSYEPYKTNILTTSEEVELRGVGDVRDELDLLTGELTQRIGEAVLVGSEDENYSIINQTTGTHTAFIVRHLAGLIKTTSEHNTDDLLSDKLQSTSHNIYNKAVEGVHNKNTNLYINLSNEKTGGTVDGLKAYLQSNPIKLQYQLATESIKKVDLKTINENGESVYFMPLEGTMHVSCHSQTIHPTFDMSVPVEATTQNLASFIDLEMEE